MWQGPVLFPAQMVCHIPQKWKLDAGIQLGYMITSPTGLGLGLAFEVVS